MKPILKILVSAVRFRPWAPLKHPAMTEMALKAPKTGAFLFWIVQLDPAWYTEIQTL